MRKTRLPIRLLTAALATGRMLTTTAATAQTASSRSEERPAGKSGKGGKAPAEQAYPDATREDPAAKAYSKHASKPESQCRV